MKLPYARAFLPCVPNQLCIERLFGLKHCIDAFGRNDLLTLEGEDERRILTIKNNNVDLVAEVAFAVDDVCGRGAVSLGQIGLQEVQPYALACVSFAWGMTK